MNKLLLLSENNRVITNTGTVQSYPDHPDRFDVCYQVLCRESVCGRCYWEIEWSGDRGVCIYQCHIRASVGRDVLSVCLDLMISPGVCSALAPDAHSDTIT